MITNLNEEYKKLHKKAIEGTLTQEEVEEFKSCVEDAKDSNRISPSQIEKFEKKSEGLEQMINPSEENNSKDNKIKKRVISGLAVFATVGVIVALAHSCSNGKSNSEEPTTIEQTNETETETKTEIETQENKEMTSLEKVKEDAIELGKYYYENGYLANKLGSDVDAFADYLASYSIAQNSENLSIKDLSEILSDGNFNDIKVQTAEQNITDFFGTVIANGGYNFSNIQSTELRKLMIKIDKKVQSLKDASVQERANICIEIQNLVDGGITLGNNVAISSNDLYAAYSYALMIDHITASAGGVNIYLANFVNSLPCQNASVIYDYNNETEIETNLLQFNFTGNTIDNRTAILNVISNDMKDRISMAIQYGISEKTEYSYKSLVEKISIEIKEYIKNNEVKKSMNFTDLVNKYTNERTTYLDSLNNIEIIDENDTTIYYGNGEIGVIDPTDMKNHGATTEEEYTGAVKKEDKEKSTEALIDKEGNTIATGKDLDDDINKFVSDSEKGSADGARKGQQDAKDGKPCNPNPKGNETYKKHYISSYKNAYNTQKKNQENETTKSEFVPTKEKEVETSTTITTIHKPVEQETTAFVPEISVPIFNYVYVTIGENKYYGYYDENGNFKLADDIIIEEETEIKKIR